MSYVNVYVQCWSVVRTRWCQDQEDYSLVYLKDLLRLRKILTFTCTIGCEVKYPLESPRASPPGGVFPVVSPQCVGREKDRLRYVNAKVWDSQNYSSYHEHKEQADKVLQTEINKGYVQWSASRDELEHEVGTLQLAKIAVIVKGETSSSHTRHEAKRHERQSRFP